jgi:cytochrome P450
MAAIDDATTGSAVRRVRDLPGPPGLPLIGNALQVDRENLHLIAERWSRRYGDAFRFRLTSREIVVMSNPETIAGILRDRPGGFQRTRRLEQTAREFGFDGLFSSNGETWKRQRPMVLNGLDPAHVRTFFPTLVNVTRRFAQRWGRAAAAGEAIDLQSDLMRYTVDVTAGLAFGTDINTLESDQEVIQSHLDKVFPALFKRLIAPVSYWRFLKLPSDRRLDRHLAALRSAVAGFIAEARARLGRHPELREHPTNLIEAMLGARDSKDSVLTDQDVSGNVLTMLLAGEDTTANTLAWAIWLLHAHPEAAQRAAEEVRGVLGADAIPVRHEQLHRLDFVEACAHETMRLRPVAPLIMVQAVHDTVAGGVALPAGTLVMCLMRPGAVDPLHFPDPHAFRPERWLAGAGPSHAATSAKRVAMPFGAGPRICPGRYLALAEMKMALAMLFGSFDLESVTTPDGGEARERLAFTMSPVGLRLRVKTRTP